MNKLFFVLIIQFSFRHAYGSVFKDSQKWPTEDSGYTIIPVCIVEGSSASEKLGGIFHDFNPSIGDVIGRVRMALSDGWEKHSNIRFVGWRPCNDLSQSEKESTLGIYIHPDADNNCHIGTNSKGRIDRGSACSWKPWGPGHARCLNYNWGRTYVEYDFACAEQYGLHEIGHAIGFFHEWNHYNRPSTCTQGTPIQQTDASTSYSSNIYTVVDSNYDWNSILTYVDGCAHVNGVRFGSPNLSPIDIQGVAEVYPPPRLGINDVGVIPNKWTDCPNGKLIDIFMDNEDSDNNNHNSGWLGAITQGRNTHFRFCRVDGKVFGNLRQPQTGTGNYAVLRLGESCPTGSFEFRRYIDNQDATSPIFSKGAINVDWMSGETGPTSTGRNQSEGTGIEMFFCFFKTNRSQKTLLSLPNLGFDYGVFAANDFSDAITTGSLYTDDEGSNNNNQLTKRDKNPLSSQERALVSGLLDTNGDGANGHTKYSLALVSNDMNDYTRLNRGTLPVCPKGRSLTLEQCREAGLVSGAKLRDGRNVVVGRWTHTPSGCFTNPTEDNAIHYSVNSRGTPGPRYSLLCTKSLPSVDEYVQYARGSAARCPAGRSLTEEQCHEAGLAFSGFFRDGKIQVGSWSHTPSGCFLNPTEDNAIHYAVNVRGTKADNRYTVLCLR